MADDTDPAAPHADIVAAPEPVGAGDWTVAAGDSMASIADATGHFWQTLWDAPENAALRAAREDPETLTPGDGVHIPPPRAKTQTRACDLVHRFKRKGVPVRIGFEVRRPDGGAFADKPFTLRVGKRRYSGNTDADGRIEVHVAPAAKTGLLTVEIDEKGFPKTMEWEIEVGRMPPLETVAGVKARLANLGHDCDPTASTFTESDRDAIRRYQRSCGLAASGTIDRDTLDALESGYGY